jgi:succinylarginine dihydrolase
MTKTQYMDRASKTNLTSSIASIDAPKGKNMFEMNFDGLIGPTHNYAGLSMGNVASATYKGARSNPKQAALQGLGKMKFLMGLGIPQGIMPPHARPLERILYRLGFSGTIERQIQAAYRASPSLLANLYSASNMWSANAATVSPRPDTMDRKIHFTPANLISMPHRALEPEFTTTALRRIFHDQTRFVVHDPLPATDLFGDEGAANHNRLCAGHAGRGLEVFVYGREGLKREGTTKKFPARQTLEASQAVARLHGLGVASSFEAQNPKAIDGGAFHNDVVAVANERVFLYHERAFADPDGLEDRLKRACGSLAFEPIFVRAMESDLPWDQVIASYVFNSQLVSIKNGHMALILPTDAEGHQGALNYVANVLEGDNPVCEAHYLDVRESMKNGGGPACLRLRVVMDEADLLSIASGVVMDEAKIEALEAWVNKHYRDRLDPEDLGDPALALEAQTALDEFTHIVGLTRLYEFQNEGVMV